MEYQQKSVITITNILPATAVFFLQFQKDIFYKMLGLS